MMNIIIWLMVLQSISVTHQFLDIPNFIHETVPKEIATNIREIVNDLSPELKNEIIESSNKKPGIHLNLNTNKFELNGTPFKFIISKGNKRYRVKLIKKPGSKERSHHRNSASTENILRTRYKTNKSHHGKIESPAYANRQNSSKEKISLRNGETIKEKGEGSELKKLANDVESSVIRKTGNYEKAFDINPKFNESLKDDENKDNSQAKQIDTDNTKTNTDKINQNNDVTPDEQLSFRESDINRSKYPYNIEENINIAEDIDKSVLNVKFIDNAVTRKLLECLIINYPELRSRLKTKISNILKVNRENGDINFIIKGTLKPNSLYKLFGLTSFYDKVKVPNANLPASYELFYKIPEIMAKIKRKHPEINENYLHQYLIRIFSKLYPDWEHITKYNILRTQPLTSMTQSTQQIKYKNILIPRFKTQPNHKTETDQEWYKMIKFNLPKNRRILENYEVINQNPELQLQLALAFPLLPKDTSQKQYSDHIKVNRLKPRQKSRNRFRPRFGANRYSEKIPSNRIIYLQPGDQYLAIKPKIDYFDDAFISENSEKWVRPENSFNRRHNSNLFYSKIHDILRQGKYKPVTKYYFPFYPTLSPIQGNEKNSVQTYAANIYQNNLIPAKPSTETNYIRPITDQVEIDDSVVNETDPSKLYMSKDDSNDKELVPNKGIASDFLNNFAAPESEVEQPENYEMPSQDLKYNRDKPKIFEENEDTEYPVNNERKNSEIECSEESNEYSEINKLELSNDPQKDEQGTLAPKKTTDTPEINESLIDRAGGVPDIFKVNESISPDSTQHIIPEEEDDDIISPEIPLDEENKNKLHSNKSQGFENINSDIVIPDTENNDKSKSSEVMGTFETEQPHIIKEIQANDKIPERITPNTDESTQHIIPEEEDDDIISPEIPLDEENKNKLHSNKSQGFENINSDIVIPDTENNDKSKSSEVMGTFETEQPHIIKEIQANDKIPERITPNTDESIAHIEIKEPHIFQEMTTDIDDNMPKILDSFITSESKKPSKTQEVQIDTIIPETVSEIFDDDSPETDQSNAINPPTISESRDDNTPKSNNSNVAPKIENSYEIQEVETDTKSPDIVLKNPDDNYSPVTDESNTNSESLVDNSPKIENSFITSVSEKPYELEIDIKRPEILNSPENNSQETDKSYSSEKPPIVQSIGQNIDNPQNNTGDSLVESENKEPSDTGIQTDIRSPEIILGNPDNDSEISSESKKQIQEHVTNPQTNTPDSDKRSAESENEELSVIGLKTDTSSTEKIFESPHSNHSQTLQVVTSTESLKPYINQQQEDSLKTIQKAEDIVSNVRKSEDIHVQPISEESAIDSVPKKLEENLENKVPETYDKLPLRSIEPYIDEEIQSDTESPQNNVPHTDVYDVNKKDVIEETQTHRNRPDYNSRETAKNVVSFKSVEPNLNQQKQADSSKNIENLDEVLSDMDGHSLPENVELIVEKIDDSYPETADTIVSSEITTPYVQDIQTEEHEKITNDKTSNEGANDGVEYNLDSGKTENSGQDRAGDDESNIETKAPKTENEKKAPKTENETKTPKTENETETSNTENETTTPKTENEPKTSKPVILEDKNFDYLPPVEESDERKLVTEHSKKSSFDSSELESILGLPKPNFKNYFIELTANMLNSTVEKLKKYLKNKSVNPDIISKIENEVRLDMKKILFIEGRCPDKQVKRFVKKLANSIKEKRQKYLIL